MAKIQITADHVIVKLPLWRQILSLSTGFTIPLENVRGATMDPGAAGEPKGLRSPGTYIPGVLTLGTFYRDGERTFWDVHNRSRVVVLQLTGERYDRLVLEVENPRTVVEHIEAATRPS
ncbi:hypothetical protein [Kineosporia babensis]|uniref:Bacterial Pleckstrin homology domain-containing protein n=1 Tax=Kineosporia babensis TaxID=499548 RepID=A0A9X1NIJ3_9ACTN|nr:hypothetical protein [Kineosporia babensis]MCD5314416.1 hypothetical protein [Kineosporia babensis]